MSLMWGIQKAQTARHLRETEFSMLIIFLLYVAESVLGEGSYVLGVEVETHAEQ